MKRRSGWVVLVLCLGVSAASLWLPSSSANSGKVNTKRASSNLDPRVARIPPLSLRGNTTNLNNLAMPNAMPLTPLAPFIDLQEAGLTTVSDGVGLLTWNHFSTQTLNVTVGGTVRFALLYWAGQDAPCSEAGGVCVIPFQPYEDQEMIFNGTPITGTVIGTEQSAGPSNSKVNNIGYFADVTSLVSAAGPGPQSFTLADGNGTSNLDSLKGASLVVAFTDASEPRSYRVIVWDNLDYAFSGDTGLPAAQVTDPVNFGYGAISSDRPASLTIIAGDGEALKSDETTVTGNTALSNLLDSSDDANGWDNDTVTVNIPALQTTTTVQINSNGPAPDEFLWIAAMLRVPQFEGIEPTCTKTFSAGPPQQVSFNIQDTGSGLAEILVTKSENADTVVPPFIPGTTTPVVANSTKINQSQPMKIEIRVTDIAGNVHFCDFDDSCSVTCPENITQSNDPNQCGAVVTYPAPTIGGDCGTVTCSPASGSLFPVGTTTVNCTSTVGPSCSFTVTVNDTQPPVMTCPENISVIAEPNDPGTVIEYPTPIASDNCPEATVVCTPASGTAFPAGTTTVTCTATDASSNTATCSFNVLVQCTSDAAFNNTSPLVISRFRENGPDGPTDEFVEIFNPSNSPHTVSSGTCSGGYGVFASAGNGTTSNTVSLVCQIPNDTVIPARGYYLCKGTSYSLSNLGRNGGASTAEGDTTIGCGEGCLGDIPNDAGLALINVGTNTVVNTAGGFAAASLPDAALVVFDKIGFAPYGAGAPAAGYPSLAGNFCEGTCLQPVGDASNLPTCTNTTEVFPVVSIPPACYGQSGQYELLRRQTVFNSATGTLHQDTNANTADILMVSPNPGINVGINVTGIAGVKPVLGAAAPHDTTAPPDFPTTILSRTPFDAGAQTGPRNAERLYSLDPTVLNPANNPLGTYALRFKYTNNSGAPITSLRFSMDDLSTLCGPQNAAPETGTGEARNLSATPNCQNGNTFTAILKLLNSAAEVVVDSTSTAQSVKGTVIEDLTGGEVIIGDLITLKPSARERSGLIEMAAPLSPLGGGIDNSLVVNPSTSSNSVGDGVNGGTGDFFTVIGTTEPNKHLRVKVKFGVVRTGRFIILVVPMGKTGIVANN